MPVIDREVTWERGLAALRRYVAVKGSARCSLNARADGVDVGCWAEARRAQYWAGTLHPQRTAALERLPGWDWNGPNQRRWHALLAALTRYARIHGTAQVPTDTAIDRLHIGTWAAAQRTAHAAGTLPAPNAALLEALPGWTWRPSPAWHENRKRSA